MAEKVYWDSDCFLAWLQDEASADLCRQVWESARDGNVIIVTSALTLAEVLAMKRKTAIPKEKRDDVINFFKNEYIVVINLDRKIAENARDLVWDSGIDPKDAVHVATALKLGLNMMHTFDADLIKKTGTLGTPRLIIEQPRAAQPKFDLKVVKNEEEKKSRTEG
ncbi:MAG: type II toxin-antitoxin system VapC family toxin [Pseudomonadota bacterium]